MNEHQDEASTVEFKAKCQLLFQESLLRKYHELLNWECTEEDNETSPELNAFLESTKEYFPEYFDESTTEMEETETTSNNTSICGPQSFLNSFKLIIMSPNEIKFILHSNLTNEELVQLSTTLFSPLLKYPKCGQSWLNDIFSFFKLPLAEWIVSNFFSIFYYYYYYYKYFIIIIKIKNNINIYSYI